MKQIMNYEQYSPEIAEDVYIAPGAFVIGRTRIGKDSSVFFNTVLRGDINSIEIGERTNIQDNCTVHLADQYGVVVGNDVTVGHNVILHACAIGDNVLVGMGAIVMDGAVIGKNSIIAAGALVTRGKEFPEGSLIMGNPAKVVREVTLEEIEAIGNMAKKYIKVKNNYLNP